MLYPIMPIYLKSIGFSIVLIGILEGIAEAIAGLSKGYFGLISDKVRLRMPFVRTGYWMSTIAKPLMAMSIAPIWIFFVRTLDRFGKGVRSSARDAILSDETTTENKGKVFGFHRALDTFGAAIGPFIALGFLYFLPGQYKWLFVLAFIPGLISVIIIYLVKEKRQILSNEKINFFSFFEYFKYWKLSSLNYKKVVIGIMFFTLFNSSDVFLLLLLKNNGMNDLTVIGFYIFYNIIFSVFAFPMGYLGDRIGLKTIFIIGLISFSIVYIFIGFVTSFYIIAILFFIYGIYAACNEGIAKAIISNIADRKETATAIGFFNSFSSVFTMLASSIGGLIWYEYGAKTMFITSGIAVSISALYFVFIKLENK